MISSNRAASRATAVLALGVTMALLSACSHPSRPAASGAGAPDIYERSTQRLAQKPADAAACIAEHARSGGHSAEMVPLYGMESVAVTVKTGIVGDMLAVLSLTRSDAGSLAATTTWTGAVSDRKAFVRELVQGC